MFVQRNARVSFISLHLSQCYFCFTRRRIGSYLTEETGIRSSGISMDSQRPMGTCIYPSTSTLGTDTSCLHKTGKVTPTFAYPRGEALWYVIPWNDTCSPCDSIATPRGCIGSPFSLQIVYAEIQASTINFVDTSDKNIFRIIVQGVRRRIFKSGVYFVRKKEASRYDSWIVRTDEQRGRVKVVARSFDVRRATRQVDAPR